MANLHPDIEARAQRLVPRSALADQTTAIFRVARPALRLLRGGDTPATSRSWVGGLPVLPAEFAWPTWDPTDPIRHSVEVLERKMAEAVPTTLPGGYVLDRRPYASRRRDRLLAMLADVPRPLSFLAQINLADADPVATASVGVPNQGVVWVFQDAELIYPRQPASWRVIYDPTPASPVERPTPGALVPFARAAVSLRPGITLPFNLDRPLDDPADDGWAVTDLETAINAEPDGAIAIGSIGGGSRGDEWCQPRVYANATLADGESATDRWPELVERSRSWRCLLDLASDKERDPRWLWGDVGSLTYWLSGPDYRDRRFEAAWLYLDTT